MSTTHYDFTQHFRTLYDKAVDLYNKGQRGPETYFDADETAFLRANGISPQHLYDYAEDDIHYGEPGYDRALGVELVRRDYFLNIQDGQASHTVSEAESWPAKTETVRNIAWLPRLLPKARAKLRGELPSSVMYPCGGDRQFFKTHNIQPAEFLSLIWRNLDNDEATLDWVEKRIKSS